MRVAIVHEWLVTYAGSEKVLRAMLAIFPDADVFCLVDVLPESARGWLKSHRVRTSFLQRMPGVARYHRYLLPLMPIAVEQFDLSGYDLVISNSHAVAKGALTGGDQLQYKLLLYSHAICLGSPSPIPYRSPPAKRGQVDRDAVGITQLPHVGCQNGEQTSIIL